MSLPGRPQPGLNTPGADHPGYESPGYPQPASPSATGVATDATGTTDLGTLDGDRDTVLVVSVDADVSDFEFQINVGGVAVFDAPQEMSQTGGEEFVVTGENRIWRDAVDETIDYEVTTAGSAGSADVTVTALSEEHV